MHTRREIVKTLGIIPFASLCNAGFPWISLMEEVYSRENTEYIGEVPVSGNEFFNRKMAEEALALSADRYERKLKMIPDNTFPRTIDSEENIATTTSESMTSGFYPILCWYLYELTGNDPSVRGPFLIRYPGKIPPGTLVELPVQQYDIAETMLSIAGFTEKKRQEWIPDAMGLLKLIEMNTAYENYRDFAVCAFRNTGYGPGGTYFDPPVHATMFLSGSHKLNVFHNFDDPNRLESELFNMERDPFEKNNLWDELDYQSKKIQMMHRLADWMVKTEIAILDAGGGERFNPQVIH